MVCLNLWIKFLFFILLAQLITPTDINLKEFSAIGYPNFKSWDDNSFALSCTGYRHPDELSNYKYNGEGDGIYKLEIHIYQFLTFCEMDEEDGYYTEIIKRQPNGLDSADTTYWNKDWDYYVDGFGEFNQDFWLGLEAQHLVTTQANNQHLKVYMKDENDEAVAFYNTFKVLDSLTFYELEVNQYDSINSNAGDCLLYHTGNRFTAQNSGKISCVTQYTGGF